MSVIKIDPVSIEGYEKFVDTIKKAVSVKAAKETANQLKNRVEQNIRTGYYDHIPTYGTWAPLSPERWQVLNRANLLPHHGLVAETQNLIGSLKMESIGDNKFRVSVGDGIDYAFAQEFGGGRGNIPARPFFNPAINHFKAEEIPKKIIRETLSEVKGAK